MKTTLYTVIAAGLAAGVSACMPITPNLDQKFGEAVNQAKAQQTLNPDASLNTDPVAGLDGVAANAAIDNYTKSVKAKPEPATIINIGGGLSGSGN